MGFTIREEESKVELAKLSKNTTKVTSKAEEKEFYSFLQKLNLRTEMGLE